MPRKHEDREGWWQAVPGSPSPRVHGKIEWERWDTHSELDALVSGVDAPEGAVVQVLRGDRVILEGGLARRRWLLGRGEGRARLTRRTDQGADVPELQVGEEVLLRVGGHLLARAVLEAD